MSQLEFRMVLPQTALVILRNYMFALGSCHVAGERAHAAHAVGRLACPHS